MNLDNFQIDQSSPIKQALLQIENNHHGIILVIDDRKIVIGLATDGDIRRALLKGASIEDPIKLCANPEFVCAHIETPREQLLKQLDQSIRVIPILDAQGCLNRVVSHDHMPTLIEEQVYSRSRAPVRISFGGGGSDLTHYFWDDNGAVINATVSLYSHATLKLRDDSRIVIRSMDLGETLEGDNLKEILNVKGKFGLIQATLKVIQPDFGFELFINSDFPIGSGLGGSAVVTSAIIGCFNEFRRDKWDSHEIAQLAFQAERFNLGLSGGWQDQYASVFGGFNFIEFRKEENVVHPLRIKTDIILELEESLLLCNTGLYHDSGAIHDDQRHHMQSMNVKEKVKTNVELTYEMRNSLLRGKLYQLGKSLHKAWTLKRGFSEKISNAHLDDIYDYALQNGAVGGKLLGAGGGGFFLFYVTPFKKHDLTNALEAKGLAIRQFRFDQDGLCSWMVRENDNQL